MISKYVKFTKIKGGCQSGRKVVAHDSKSDLPLTPMILMAQIFEIKLLIGTLAPRTDKGVTASQESKKKGLE